MLGILWCKSQRGRPRRGVVWQGQFRPDQASCGVERAANGSAGGYGLLRCSFGSGYGKARTGRPVRGPAGCGGVGFARARAADGGTEGLQAFPVILTDGLGAVSLGAARQSRAGLVSVRLVRVWQGLRQQHGGLRLSLLLSFEGGHAVVRFGVAPSALVRQGTARQGLTISALSPSGLSAGFFEFSCAKAWPGTVWQVVVR